MTYVGTVGVPEALLPVMSVYPNPVKDICTISCSGQWNAELFSVSGVLIKRFEGEGTQTFIRGNIPAGIYSLTVYHAGSKSQQSVVFH